MRRSRFLPNAPAEPTSTPAAILHPALPTRWIAMDLTAPCAA
jgi:hypothetical protein